jgi:hypothetical protein
MAYKARATYLTDTAASFTSGSNKWRGQEVEDRLTELGDSVAWESQKYTISSGSNYDCDNGNLQQITLSGNATLTISNAEAGKYYTLIKKGAFTLTLPTSEFSSSGSVTGTGTTIITFLYDGTDYYFSFSTYSAT